MTAPTTRMRRLTAWSAAAAALLSLPAACTSARITPPAGAAGQSCTDRDRWAFAYVKYGDRQLGLYLHADGENTMLVDDREATKGVNSPQLSPDGERLLFNAVLGDARSNEIWIMNLDGSGLHPFEPRGTLEAAWSPDGRSIAYMDRDTSALVVRDLADGTERVAATDVEGGVPVWSHDASAIAWRAYSGRLLWTAVDGSDSGAIAPPDHAAANKPAWLPGDDGLVAAMIHDDELSLYTVDLSGTGEPELLLAGAAQPFALPDGTIGALPVEYLEDDSDLSGLVSIDPAGGEPRPLVTIPGSDASAIGCYD